MNIGLRSEYYFSITVLHKTGPLLNINKKGHKENFHCRSFKEIQVSYDQCIDNTKSFEDN